MNPTHSYLALQQDSELVILHLDSLQEHIGSREGWRRYAPWRPEDGLNELSCIQLMVISI
jgi:hypothetical protein